MHFPFIKRLIYAGIYICTALVIFGLIFEFSKMENTQNRTILENLKRSVKGKRLDAQQVSAIKGMLEERKGSVYLVLLDPIEKRGLGIVNAESFTHGGQYIESMLQQKGMFATFEHLKNTSQAPNPHIELVQDYWIEQSMQVRYAYLNPTYYKRWKAQDTFLKNTSLGKKTLPTNGMVSSILLKIWYVLGLLMALFYLIFCRNLNVSPKLEIPIAETVEQEKENMKFLQERAEKEAEPVQPAEKEISADLVQDFIYEEEDDDTKIDDIPPQVWIKLLDEPDLKDWENKGHFYVRNDKKGLHAIGFPWGSSIVTRKEVLFPEFIFEAEARVLTGSEGFVVLFGVGNFCLSWVIGGWGNTKSIVMGYETTKTTHQIHRKKWYHVRVELEENEVVGYIDGRTAWTLQKADVTKDSPELGFQKGLGVGVWKTTTKFRNIRVLKV